MASVEVGDVFESASGKVFINIFGNHVIPLNFVVQAVYEVEALDVVRRELLRQQRIRDLPILLVDPAATGDSRPRSNGIAHERACRASYGDTSTPAKHIGECYLIELGPGHSFEDLLAMMVALSDLSPGVRRIEVNDLAAFRAARSARSQRFRNLVLHFDPIWSPDGTRLLYTVWERGGIRFELLEPLSRAVTRLGPLDGYMATRPSWSGDGRFIAYASLKHDVKVFDTQTRTTRTFRPREASVEIHVLVLWEGTRLRFAFHDGNTGYEMYAHDAVRGELQRVASDAGRQAWMDHAQEHVWAFDRLASLSPVRNPTGRYVAIFTLVRGQRRVEVKALH